MGPGPGSGSGREKPGLPALSEEGCRAAYAEPLPTFRDVPASEKQLLFVRKLHLCAYTFDFTDQGRAVREKEIKRQTLLELVDYVNQGSGKFTEAVAEDIVFMLSSNLFRALPPTKSHDQDNLDPDEEEPALEPAWPHLQVVSLRLGHAQVRALSGAPCLWGATVQILKLPPAGVNRLAVNLPARGRWCARELYFSRVLVRGRLCVQPLLLACACTWLLSNSAFHTPADQL